LWAKAHDQSSTETDARLPVVNGKLPLEIFGPGTAQEVEKFFYSFRQTPFALISKIGPPLQPEIGERLEDLAGKSPAGVQTGDCWRQERLDSQSDTALAIVITTRCSKNTDHSDERFRHGVIPRCAMQGNITLDRGHIKHDQIPEGFGISWFVDFSGRILRRLPQLRSRGLLAKETDSTCHRLFTKERCLVIQDRNVRFGDRKRARCR
jgi:hypothetical protein